MLVALPGLRLGKWYLALLSIYLVLVFGDVIPIVPNLTGGFGGIYNLPPPAFFGLQFGTNAQYWLILGFVLMFEFVFYNLLRSRWGPAFATLRENEVAAATLGLSRYGIKVLVYALGSLPAALAGGLYVYSERFVDPSAFTFSLTLLFLAAVFLGGERTLIGPVIGVLLLQLLPILSTSTQQFSPYVYGAALIVFPIAAPRGLMGVGVSLRNKLSGLRLLPVRIKTDATNTAGEAAMGRSRMNPELSPPPERMMSSSSRRDESLVLRVNDAVKRFAGLTALAGVTLEVNPGMITGLMGPNGSGKTTLLNVISGFYRIDSGTITFGDRPIAGMPSSRIAQLGITRTFQTPVMPVGLSACEVVQSAYFTQWRASFVQDALRLPQSLRERRRVQEASMQLLRDLELASVARTPASSLPLGQRRIVEVARAIAMNPSVMLLDEPASGLGPDDIDRLSTLLRQASGMGIACLVVEHNVPMILGLADVVYVLDFGKVLAVGDPHSLLHNPEVVRAYLGDFEKYSGVL
jgi:branched-chain amino acid transport system permease protein